jgi:rubrerythrin
VIERRAMRLYPLYKSVTHDQAVREGLETIIREENTHLHLIEEGLHQLAAADDSITQDIENTLFSTFETVLRGEVNHYNSAA